MHDADTALLELAARQHGLVSRQQARDAGLTRSALAHRIRHGGWQPVTPRVLRRTGAPPSDEQRALAAVLDVGRSTYASHHSAMALWGHPGFRVQPVQVMGPRGALRGSPAAVVHHPRHLPDPFAAELRGVPVVRPALLLLQMAALVHPERLRRFLDWFWNRRLLSAASVRAELADVMHRGRHGTAALRELLDDLPEDYVPPASGLEARFEAILRDAGLPEMRRQVDLGGDEAWSGRVDFLALDRPLVVEVDSERYHGALTSRADDAARQARLETAGFVVVRVRDFQVWHRPAEVVALVRAARWAAVRPAA